MASKAPNGPTVPPDYWPCACVKGGSVAKRRPSTHIKVHPPTAARCRVCGATRAEALRIQAEFATPTRTEGAG